MYYSRYYIMPQYSNGLIYPLPHTYIYIIFEHHGEKNRSTLWWSSVVGCSTYVLFWLPQVCTDCSPFWFHFWFDYPFGGRGHSSAQYINQTHSTYRWFMYLGCTKGDVLAYMVLRGSHPGLFFQFCWQEAPDTWQVCWGYCKTWTCVDHCCLISWL